MYPEVPAIAETAAVKPIELDWNVSCTSAPVVVPGCDTLIARPSNAVVGAFVKDAQTYWAPDAGKATANPSIVLPAGKTVWVHGLDASKSFYKIEWQCSLLWVPANTLGPNFDKVWNGAPLPATVVN
jgi:hypothetical protein